MSSHATATSSRRPPGSFSPISALSSTSAIQIPPNASYVGPARPDLSVADSDTDSRSYSPSSSRPLVPQRKVSQQSVPPPQQQPSSQPHQFANLPPLNTNAQNFSRPTAASRISDASVRAISPLSIQSATDFPSGHSRKHSNSQGFFEPTLPSTLSSSMAAGGGGGGTAGLTTSQIAAQAAVQHAQAQAQAHHRQRSQTVPSQPESMQLNTGRRPSKGPLSPPLLSLTEASAPQGGFAGQGQSFGTGNGLLGARSSVATTAANVVFARSPQTSPNLPPNEFVVPDKPAKSEKSKVKLFSRPGKIGTSKDKDKDVRDKAQPSPNKLGNFAMQNFQRNNMSLQSLAEPPSASSSMYNMSNSSAATIRAVDSYGSLEKEAVPTTQGSKDKEKQHRHHFLSRQKHKLGSKDDHQLHLSSASSNSMPSDPKAPSTLYNFNVPASPGPGSTSFSKSMSGLDLRHGGRALREKKREERAAAASAAEREREDSISEWPGPSSLGSTNMVFGPPSSGYAGSIYGSEVQDLAKYGLNNMTIDDAWPYLRAKLLIIFEGDELRLPVEDFNRLVSLHLRNCIQKRSPLTIVEDVRDFLTTGFGSLDQTLRHIPDDRLVPSLIQMWILVYTKILPYIQAVFLPLDLEFAGQGSMMSADTAREFWGPLTSSQEYTSPLNHTLEVRRIVLVSYRDTVITPRYETLKTVFSRLSLESINNNLASPSILSSSPDSFGGRPGTATSLDPAVASYNSQSTTLLGGSTDTPLGARSRAISNVSYGSNESSSLGLGLSLPRSFTPGSGPSQSQPHIHAAIHSLQHQHDQREREANNEDSKYVTEMVGRMLQCMSVLASLGGPSDDERQRKMEELCRALKLNWLGRGRTGRNRRGFVAAKMQPVIKA